MTPPGLTTRRISRSTATGSGTAEIVYVASALSNSLSPKSSAVASMTLRVTFGMASVCTRSTALSSISCERSMPMRRAVGGYSGRLSPVPMPTSSVTSLGARPSCLTAAARPGAKIQSKMKS